MLLTLWGISGRFLEFVVPKLTSERELVQSFRYCCGVAIKRDREGVCWSMKVRDQIGLLPVDSVLIVTFHILPTNPCFQSKINATSRLQRLFKDFSLLPTTTFCPSRSIRIFDCTCHSDLPPLSVFEFLHELGAAVLLRPDSSSALLLAFLPVHQTAPFHREGLSRM